MENTSSTPYQNRLANEKSPYLLQHAHNPVDWYPWGEEAFVRARTEHKPIFLSIGYSTCHWCHVMERESFANPATARFLNAHFVSIKVDREERPDVDKVYMDFVISVTGQGGWPLTVFLTPQLQPFFGGTYFPPENRYNHPGFLEVLQQIQQAWETSPGEIGSVAKSFSARLANAAERSGYSPMKPSPDFLHTAAAKLKAGYDPVNGGEGTAPKFPQPSIFSFLLGYSRLHKDPEAEQMVLHTCRRMAAGGVHDQLGGGFHRYATDSQWLVPHFEKMLYDNALLLQLYLDAFLASGVTEFADVAHGIAGYVLRDMSGPAGEFYSAEDADSEGQEGKFYCWTKRELKTLLTAAELDIAVRVFHITDEGNFIDQDNPEPLPGLNVLSRSSITLDDREKGLVGSARKKMLAVRSRRVRPQRDDKVLCSWNGLMLGALARAGVILGERSYLEAARRSMQFIRSRLWDEIHRILYHRWREGEHDRVQLLRSYAFLLSGLMDYYEATLESISLNWAVEIAEEMIGRFYDRGKGGFWQGDAEELIVRIKDDQDGAEPAGNSEAIMGLLKLAAVTGKSDFRTAAEKSLDHFAQRLASLPQAWPRMMQALGFWLQEPHRVVIVGDAGNPLHGELLAAVHRIYRPFRIVLGNSGPVDSFAASLTPVSGKPAAYVCTGNVCQLPTSDPSRVSELLSIKQQVE